jgi:hypothetical protein
MSRETLDYDTVTICPYCANETRGRTACCGESSAHFERHTVIFSSPFTFAFVESETGSLSEEPNERTRVYD